MKLRQLPKLYLRGSIVNETIQHLNDSERESVESITNKIINMPLLGGVRHRFREKLSTTIAADYSIHDTGAVDQEFHVAMWRAVVYLLYHSDYSFQCKACKATKFNSGSGRVKKIDRRFPICPACKRVTITDPGSSAYRTGQHITIKFLQNSISKHAWAQQPKHTSPIISVRGKKKIESHAEILNDPHQIVKYFGDFASNYIRQILRENVIKKHVTKSKTISGPADWVAAEELHSVLTSFKVPHVYEARGNPQQGAYRIQVELLLANQTVSAAIRSLIVKYRQHNIKIEATETELAVLVIPSAKQVEAQIRAPQVVCIQTAPDKHDDNDSMSSSVDAYHHSIVSRGESMQQDGIAQIESSEVIAAIREGLSDNARQVLEITLNYGPAYDQFLEYHRQKKLHGSTEKPSIIDIAKFLNVDSKIVTRFFKDIEVHCLVNGVGNY